MIGKLKGKIDQITNGYAIIDVGGVGYRVHLSDVSMGRIAKQQEVELYIHTHVREDQITLYGFQSQDELGIFELLLSISGIGPKAALGILTIASPSTIKNAIVEGDSSILTRVSGVGKKTAERVILELKNKIDTLPMSDKKEARADQEVVEALMAMGYSAFEAREAYRAVPKDAGDISEKIKHALKAMRK